MPKRGEGISGRSLFEAWQEEVETCGEYSIFTLYFSPTWDFTQELLMRKMMGRYE
jgi:hypothetical protein